MALPDITFQNNLGTITIKRCLLSVSDDFQWDGRIAKRTKRVDIDGFVERNNSDPEGLEAILTTPSEPGLTRGDRGTLTLPWTVLTNIGISSIDYPVNQWLEVVPVKISFLDDRPEGNQYTLSWFGFTLHNPQLYMPVPTQELSKDAYPQIPWHSFFLSPTDPRAHVIRSKSGAPMMEVRLAGTIFVEDTTLPEDLIDILIQRANISNSVPVTSLVPSGYPRPFPIIEACPEMQQDCPLVGVFVAGGSMNWDIEEGSVQIELPIALSAAGILTGNQMAIVCFEKIIKLNPGDVDSLAGGDTIPRGPITVSAGTRNNVYDPVWGYFTFGQSVSFSYNEAKTYRDEAQFTINGTFTVNAEFETVDPEVTDQQAFTALVAKYEALEQLFIDCGNASAPADYVQWGTDQDPRLLPLPSPLVDKNSQIVYAFPMSLQVQPGRWPVELQYTALLREAKFPNGKLKVNDSILDRGRVQITLPAPLLERHRLRGCVGEVVQVRNYTATSITASGSMPGTVEQGRFFSDDTNVLKESLRDGKVDIGVVRLNGSSVDEEVLWPEFDLDSRTGFEVAYGDRKCEVTNARAVI